MHAQLRSTATVLLACVVGVTLSIVPGLAPATVEEQRVRLPPPASCVDPVAGEWRAHVYYEHVGEWYLFKLDVEREGDAGELRGSILAEFWNGTSMNSEPPLCQPNGTRQAVLQSAAGTIDGFEFHFEAEDWRPEETCGFSGGYLLDRFTGRIDPDRQEFQSVLNADAAEWRDVPTVFRRISCRAESTEPRVLVAPPPFFPEEPKVGCGCAL